MQIYDQNPIGPSGTQSERTQETQKSGRAGGSKSVAGGTDKSSDHVEFSSTLGRLSRTLNTFEASRASRVQALAAQFQAGNYRVDASATSRSMVSDALSSGLQ